jgi:hypothetical protein
MFSHFQIVKLRKFFFCLKFGQIRPKKYGEKFWGSKFLDSQIWSQKCSIFWVKIFGFPNFWVKIFIRIVLSFYHFFGHSISFYFSIFWSRKMSVLYSQCIKSLTFHLTVTPTDLYLIMVLIRIYKMILFTD